MEKPKKPFNFVKILGNFGYFPFSLYFISLLSIKKISNFKKGYNQI